jgi:hypothetical protein
MSLTRTSRLAGLMLAAALVGCDSSPSATPAPPGSKDMPNYPSTPGAKPGDATPSDKKAADAKPAKPFDVAGTQLSDKEIAAISKIESEPDRKIALEQKLCPMTGAHLGSMGKPAKVMLKDQAVFLCCEGCEEDAKAKPAEALAKLGK